jgi:hypothetical protein
MDSHEVPTHYYAVFVLQISVKVQRNLPPLSGKHADMTNFIYLPPNDTHKHTNRYYSVLLTGDYRVIVPGMTRSESVYDKMQIGLS